MGDDKLGNSIVVRRIVAYLIDIFIVGLIVNIILINSNDKALDDLNKEINNIMEDYASEKISTEEYIDNYVDIIYDINKVSVDRNIVYFIVIVGYYLVFQYLNKGASIGKRLMNLRIVSKDKKDINIIQLFVRVALINEMLPLGMSIILVSVCSGMRFMIGYMIISIVKNIFMMMDLIVLIARKDNRAIHDMISYSMVIEEK